MKKDINKKIKKCIVNGITLSRVAGTFALPFLYNALTAPIFITVIAIILLTDCIDGFLAKKVWHVSTIFGSLADMTADKLFGIAVLALLTPMYPMMSIPLALELYIAKINMNMAELGEKTKSSQIGRGKMWIVGASMCVLLLINMAPELITSLSNIKIIDINNNILSNLGHFGDRIVKVTNDVILNFKTYSLQFINFLKINKNVVVPLAETAAITMEALTAADYSIKYIKVPDKSNKQYKLSEYIKNKKYRDYIKKVWLDEKYYRETKEVPIFEKLTPPEYKEEVKVKKLTLDNNKK